MRLSSGGRDVFFVADVEPGTGLYKFDMDVGASAKDFSSQSGESLGQSFTISVVFMSNDFAAMKVRFVFCVEWNSGGIAFRQPFSICFVFFNLASSGKYSMYLVVGDALIANPIAWEMVDMQLTFQSDPTPIASHQKQVRERTFLRSITC